MTVTRLDGPARPVAARLARPLRHLWHAWRSVRGEDLSWFLLMGVFYACIDLSSLTYVMDNPRWRLALAHQLLSPLLVSLVLMLGWLPAARSDPDHPRRVARVLAGTLIGSMMAMAVHAWLMPMLQLPSLAELAREHKNEGVQEPAWLINYFGQSLSIFMSSILSVALYELVHRRRRTRARLEHVLQDQSAMQRRAMASRLAALQTQVEPQVLFETLVHIEHAYDTGDPAAPERMEQLIRDLRIRMRPA